LGDKLKRICSYAIRLILYAIGLLGISFLAIKGIIGLRSTKEGNANAQVTVIDKGIISNSIIEDDESDENLLKRTDEVSIEFPIRIDTWQVSIDIEDYYFVESIPNEVEDADYLEKELRKQFSRSFSEDGSFRGDILFLVMKVNVHNNLPLDWTYAVNSVSVVFGETAEEPMRFMNELFYFSKRQRNGHENMHYEFAAGETYSATYVFELRKDFFYDDSLLCLLEVNDNGSYEIEETDRIIILDKTILR